MAGGSAKESKFAVATTIPSHAEINNKWRRRKTSDEEPTTVPELLHMMQSALNEVRGQLEDEKVKTNEMRAQLENQKVKMNAMRRQVEAIETIEGDVREVKEDMGEIKGAMGEVKDGMGEVKGDMGEIKDDMGEPDHLPEVLLRVKGKRALWTVFILSNLVQLSQIFLVFALFKDDVTMSMDDLNKLVDDGLLLWHPENLSDFNNSDDINFLKAIRTESIALTEEGWRTSVINMALGIALLSLFFVQEVIDIVFTKEYHALDDTLTDLQAQLQHHVLANQIVVPCSVAITCLGSIVISSLDTAATVQAAIEAFFILEMDDKLVPVMWQIMRLTDSACTTLDGREDGVTLVESLHLGEDRHTHRRWRDAAQHVLLSLIKTSSFFVWMFFRWGLPLLAPASQHPYLKAFGDIYMFFPAAIVMAKLIVCHVEFILGMYGHKWFPALQLHFSSLSIEAYFTIVLASVTSPSTDPSKGFTGYFEGSCRLSDFVLLSKDDIMALFDGHNPVLALSAVIVCIISLVKPPPCASRWVWASAWLTLAVTVAPFSGIEELIARIMGPVPL